MVFEVKISRQVERYLEDLTRYLERGRSAAPKP